jgi:colicin import membrane protein
MKNAIALVVLFWLATCPLYLLAQQEEQVPAAQENASHIEEAAQEEARKLEQTLVQEVRRQLEKQNAAGTQPDSTQAQAPTRAEVPQPEPRDQEQMKTDVDEWESKSLAFMEGLKLQELAELAKKQEEQTKKLAEKVAREKIVVNPQRRPGGANEGVNLEKLFQEELGKLQRKFEQEHREIEQKCKRETEAIERAADKLRQAVEPKEKRGEARRPHRADDQPPEKKEPPKRRK